MLSWTWRTTIVEAPQVTAAVKDQKSLVFAHWHGDELALLPLIVRYRVATMVSTSRDGDLMSRIVEKFGGKTVRGSSTRGGSSALKSLIRLCRQGHMTSLAVDGPKGPIYQVKPGVFELARLTDSPITVVSVAASSTWTFHRAWNKAILPKPFSRVVMVVMTPQPLVSEDVKNPQLAQQLRTQLLDAKQRANSLLQDRANASLF